MCNECKIFTEKGKYYCPESDKPFKYCPFCGEPLMEQNYSPKLSDVASTVQVSDLFRGAINFSDLWTPEDFEDLKEAIERCFDEEKEYIEQCLKEEEEKNK